MNTIYYFTSTGNSLEIARQIAAKLGDTQLVSMATQPPKNQVGGPNQVIGFVFPVYFLGMPRIVKRFVQDLTIVPGTYCFAIVNYGARKQDTLGMLDDLLKKKGARLSYAEGVSMPGNYIIRYDSKFPEEAAEMRQNAQIKVEETALAISNRVVRTVERGNKLLSRAASTNDLHQCRRL